MEAIQKRVDKLTLREREVLEYILSGAPNKAIGHELGIVLRTVKAHRRSIMEKLEATSAVELVRMCIYAGIRAKGEGEGRVMVPIPISVNMYNRIAGGRGYAMSVERAQENVLTKEERQCRI
jgi:DNA-binding CsgD family transcriptional regulator